MRQTDMHTDELLILEFSSIEDEIATENEKILKPQGIVKLQAEIIQPGGNISCYEIHKFINSIWNKEELPYQWEESITVHVYKKVDRTDCRGISLLPTT
jgi:hypothetical protein